MYNECAVALVKRAINNGPRCLKSVSSNIGLACIGNIVTLLCPQIGTCMPMYGHSLNNQCHNKPMLKPLHKWDGLPPIVLGTGPCATPSPLQEEIQVGREAAIWHGLILQIRCAACAMQRWSRMRMRTGARSLALRVGQTDSDGAVESVSRTDADCGTRSQETNASLSLSHPYYTRPLWWFACC